MTSKKEENAVRKRPDLNNCSPELLISYFAEFPEDKEVANAIKSRMRTVERAIEPGDKLSPTLSYVMQDLSVDSNTLAQYMFRREEGHYVRNFRLIKLAISLDLCYRSTGIPAILRMYNEVESMLDEKSINVLMKYIKAARPKTSGKRLKFIEIIKTEEEEL